MVIGLTGQSGSGKSVVANILREKGFIVLDCDSIAHKNMEPGGIAYADIAKEFGEKILNGDGSINRAVLGSIVFNDSEKLSKLNSITHKYIADEIKSNIQKYKNVVIDAPLLFEASLDKLCDKVWAVVCPENIRIERVVKRDGISTERAAERFKNQKSEEFFRKNADTVIENIYEPGELKERVIYEINKVFV